MPASGNVPDSPEQGSAGQHLCDRVTRLRKEHKLTLEQLAAASGVSRSMLSQIERGQANPTLAVTHRIARTFGLTIGELVDEPNPQPTIELVHADDPSNLFRSDDECTIRTLSPLHMEKNVEFYEVRIAAHGHLRSAPHFQGTRELLTVTRGEAHVTSGEHTCRLGTNDSAHYRADVPHEIENIGGAELVCFLVVTYK